MISLRFDLQNPFWKDRMNDLYKVYYELEKPISKNKTFECNINRHFYFLFVLHIDLSWRGQDHAGPKFILSLFGYELSLSIHDNRHWNDEQDRWVNYDNTDEVQKYW